LIVNDYDGLLKWKRKLVDLGLSVEGPLDRHYFKSIVNDLKVPSKMESLTSLPDRNAPYLTACAVSNERVGALGIKGKN
jgi:hypothetical protein